tara:strand:- start:13358 stop:14164 length:807 start_codon:yes stop_codon:yes gene_type:complete
MAKITDLKEAISESVIDGQTIALEGFTHLIPFAAGHEIIRQGKLDLTLIRMTPDIIYDQMIGMGCAKKLIFGWAGNPGVGSLHRFRDALENGWPKPLEIEEHSHAAMANAFDAGASGLPLAIFQGYKGVDLEKLNDKIKYITCPFSEQKLVAIPSIRPDVTIIHAQKSDQKGNVLIEGITGVQKEAVLAATCSIVTVEEIVEDLEATANSIIIPSWALNFVAEVPHGAYPSYAYGYYGRDNKFYTNWDKISRDREKFKSWVDINILKK